MHGSWVGALSPCCHCPLEVGGNLSATRRCGSTTSANPSDGRSGHRALSCFKTTPGKPARKNERREKRRREHPRKTGPTPLPRELERDARDLELQSACPLAEHNRQILQGGERLCLSTVKGGRARPCSQAHRVRKWHRSGSSSRHGGL